MEHGARRAAAHNREMQQRFGAGFAGTFDHCCVAIDNDQLIGGDVALVHAAGCHQQLQGLAAHEAAEVTAGAITPTAAVDIGHDIHQLLPQR